MCASTGMHTLCLAERLVYVKRRLEQGMNKSMRHHVHKRGEARHCRSADGRRNHVLPELVASKLEAALQEVAHHGGACARSQHAQPCGIQRPDVRNPR